jgi:hypothetical protein
MMMHLRVKFIQYGEFCTVGLYSQLTFSRPQLQLYYHRGSVYTLNVFVRTVAVLKHLRYEEQSQSRPSVLESMAMMFIAVHTKAGYSRSPY